MDLPNFPHSLRSIDTKPLRMRSSRLQRFCFDEELVISFVQSHLKGLPRSDDMVAIGVVDTQTDRVIAGVVYEGINAHNLWMHIAAISGTAWARPVNLRAWFAYPFLVCGVKRIGVYVDASNALSLRLCFGLGFKHEATIAGAACDGGDVFVLVMKKEWCRYV